MQMIQGGITTQCQLSLRGVSRVLEAMHHGLDLSDVLVNVCYVSHQKYMSKASEHWCQAITKHEVCVTQPNLLLIFCELFCEVIT